MVPTCDKRERKYGKWFLLFLYCLIALKNWGKKANCLQGFIVTSFKNLTSVFMKYIDIAETIF